MLEDFLKNHQDSNISWDDLHKLGQRVRRTLEADLRFLKSKLSPDYKLTIGHEFVTIQQEYESLERLRARTNREIKQGLGALLWGFLLKIDLPGASGSSSGSLLDTLQSKLDALRRKMTISIFIDSGSSTQAAIEELLRVERIPIRTGSEGNHGVRLVIPAIVTNSIAIASAIHGSKHKRDIQVRLIGGNLRELHGSICGTLTEMCLAAWGLRGDLAVIGCTGYTRNLSGTPAFGCDDSLEARLKATMLALAWFRVLIFDSSKLSQEQVSGIFAPLSKEAIDLIVTDEGEDEKARESVREFTEIATALGVPTLILLRSKRS